MSYPALTKSNYLENLVEHDNPFEKIRYTENIFEKSSNFENYVKASKATRIIVNENGEITKGLTYWSKDSFDGFGLPAQKEFKVHCKNGFTRL